MSAVSLSAYSFDPSSPTTLWLLRNLRSRFKMLFYFMGRFPSPVWWGLRIVSLTHLEASVSIPYGWRTQNPFRSIYFAALAGAGELSTGVLGLVAMQNRKDISMLVVKQEAEFFKKANNTITFTCSQGQEVIDTVHKAMDTGEACPITMTSVGRNPEGEAVCEVRITWSFKRRAKR